MVNSIFLAFKFLMIYRALMRFSHIKAGREKIASWKAKNMLSAQNMFNEQAQQYAMIRSSVWSRSDFLIFSHAQNISWRHASKHPWIEWKINFIHFYYYDLLRLCLFSSLTSPCFVFNSALACMPCYLFSVINFEEADVEAITFLHC